VDRFGRAGAQGRQQGSRVPWIAVVRLAMMCLEAVLELALLCLAAEMP